MCWTAIGQPFSTMTNPSHVHSFGKEIGTNYKMVDVKLRIGHNFVKPFIEPCCIANSILMENLDDDDNITVSIVKSLSKCARSQEFKSHYHRLKGGIENRVGNDLYKEKAI